LFEGAFGNFAIFGFDQLFDFFRFIHCFLL
jgi:hypothetical protein